MFANQADLIQALTTTNGCILKELDIGSGRKLVLCKIDGVTLRVLLANTLGTLAKLDAGTCIGGGGPGSYVSDVSDPDKAPHGWAFTRYTEHRKDVAFRANGYFVFGEGSTGRDPQLRTLEDIEKALGSEIVNELTLYAHNITRAARSSRVAPLPVSVVWLPTRSVPQDGSTFSRYLVGQWSRSMEEQTSTGIEVKGILRPAFVVTLQGKQLSPSRIMDDNTVMLFIKKTITMKPNALIVL